MRHGTVCAAAVLFAACGSRPGSRFSAPPGFTVESALAPELSGSIVAFTFDSQGRPVAAREHKHPVLLIDSNGDGVYDREQVLTTHVKTLQGIWFDGRTMYAVGNNVDSEPGLYKVDEDGAFEQLARFERRMGEHGPHDIRRGPDGFPTVLLGNNTAIPAPLVDPTSPYRGYSEGQLLDPYLDGRGSTTGLTAPGGVLARFHEDRRRFTILFGGLRNAYNHAYNLEGEAFTFDSDTEGDINLPWYREIRSVHGVPGADYGWRTGSGQWPAYFIDSLPPMRNVGRGSPVGVEFYQHHVYPASYRDALLEADWSRGRILVSRLARNGATYSAGPRVDGFVQGEPLNVTDLEVGPDGFVYFSTGGRETEGGLYRIRYTPPFWQRFFSHQEPRGILAVVRQPQPLSSWGHAALLQAKESMFGQWAIELEQLARDTSADTMDRIQALLLLQRLGPKPTANLLRPLAADKDPRVRAAAVYVVGLHGSPRAKAIAAEALQDPDPLVQRRAAEAVVRMGLSAEEEPFAPIDSIYALLKSPDRFVRYAGRLALERTARAAWTDRVIREESPEAAPEGLLAWIRTADSDENLEPVFEQLLAWLRRADLPVRDRVRFLRVFQVAAAASRTGVRPTLRKQFSDILTGQFPHADESLSRELARVLAYCGQPESIRKLLDAMPPGDSNQQLQIHYAYCLRAIREGWSPEEKSRFLAWFPRAAQWRGGQWFTAYIDLMFEEVADPAVATPYRKQASARADRQGKRAVAAVRPEEILAYQLFDPMILKASPAKGRTLFEKDCAGCHRLGGVGKDFGPDLSTVGARFSRRDTLEAILWPSKSVSDQYESTILETRNGEVHNGLIIRESAGKVWIKTAEIEEPFAVAVADVKARRKSGVSMMPEGLLDAYNQDQISDLVAFLRAKR
ncbi:MAG: c-type cytochrome [Acidobacteria bacterium]|nr:c-type cytochrome [Acidobacteriota bacterium]